LLQVPNYEPYLEPVAEFARGAKLLLLKLEPSDLIPAYWGIRANLTPRGNPRENVLRILSSNETCNLRASSS
jgi:hypothetical protein